MAIDFWCKQIVSIWPEQHTSCFSVRSKVISIGNCNLIPVNMLKPCTPMKFQYYVHYQVCYCHTENGDTLGMVPLIINPIYALYSGYIAFQRAPWGAWTARVIPKGTSIFPMILFIFQKLPFQTIQSHGLNFRPSICSKCWQLAIVVCIFVFTQ